MNQPSLLPDIAPAGHNQPPLSQLELLQQQHAILLSTADKRMANAARIPAICKDDAMAAKITDMIKLLNSARTEIGKTHEIEKAPYWNAGKVVDGVFNPVAKKLKAAAEQAGIPLTKFQMAKVAEERKLAAEQAERARLEAEKHANAGAALEQENMHAAAGVAFAEAEAYDKRADNAEAVMDAKPSELVQTRTKSGAVASVRVAWTGEITDRNKLDLDALRAYIPMDALVTAVKAFAKAEKRQITGARIFEDAKVGVR